MHWDGSYFLHDDLDAAWQHMGKAVKLTPYARMMYVAATAIRHFLGREWTEKHIFADGAGFMSAHFKKASVPTPARDVAAMRVIELGEMLLNFQDTPGFESILAELEADKLPSTFGSLEIAMFLKCSGNELTFRVPGGPKGDSYDFDVTTKTGLSVCVEAKCVLKGNDNAKSTIRNRLRKSADQLPPGRDGAICVRVPAEWLTRDLIKVHFEPVAKQMLRNTTRVVSIIILTSRRLVHGDYSANPIMGTEIGNPRSNLDGRVKLLKPVFNNQNWFYLSRYFGLSADMPADKAAELTRIFT